MLVIYYLKIEFSSGKRDAAHCWLCTDGTESDMTENHWTGRKKSGEHNMWDSFTNVQPEHAVPKGRGNQKGSGKISRNICTLRKKEKEKKNSLFRVWISGWNTYSAFTQCLGGPGFKP